MEPLSQKARQLVDALFPHPGGAVLSMPGDNPAREALLVELGATEEAPAVLPVLSVLLRSRGRELHAAAVAVHHLVASASSREVVELDGWLRQWSGWGAMFRELHPCDVERLATVSPTVLALCACHPSGFMRERAVRRLEEVGTGHEWPFLLVRANDWVVQVRAVARGVALRRLDDVPVAILVEHLPLLDRLRRAAREDHRELVEQVEARLREPDARWVLEGARKRMSARERRRLYALLVRGGGASARWGLERALEDGDAGVRAWAAVEAGQALSADELRELFPRLQRSRVPEVRRAAYEAYGRHFPQLGFASARQALVDTRRAVRRWARLRLGEAEAAAQYREALRSTPVPPGAVAGLGEVGRRGDASLLVPLVLDERVRVRCEAARALGRLDAEGQRWCLQQAFGDAHAGVTRAAVVALVRIAGQLDAGWLREQLLGGQAPHHRRGALRLVTALPRWDALPLLLAACASTDTALLVTSYRALERWLMRYNRHFASPTARQLQAVREVLRSATGLDPTVAWDVNHLVRAFE